MWETGRHEATQERRKDGSAHSAQVMAWAVVSMPAMKKMLSSLHMRVKGSGPRSGQPTLGGGRCRCMRWLPMEASCARSCGPLHPSSKTSAEALCRPAGGRQQSSLWQQRLLHCRQGLPGAGCRQHGGSACVESASASSVASA